MQESTIADFVARFLIDSGADVEPTRGRIVLSQKRVVFVSSDDRLTVPLEDVFDVVVGHVPVGLDEFFDDTVAIAYERGSERRTAILEADGEKIGRFRTVLFKALLRGTSVRIRHPAKVGGRTTDASARKATLDLGKQSVTFRGIDTPLSIDLSDVTYFEKTDRTIDGRVRPALEVQFTADGRALTTEIVMSSARLMNLLGRYLRLEYSELVSEIESVDLSEAEMELLTAVYSGAGDGNLSSLLGMDSSSVTMLLNGLEEKRLVTSTKDGTQLTSLGRLAVSDRVEAVNA